MPIDLKRFIAKPSHRCTADDLEQGISALTQQLNIDPHIVMKIMADPALPIPTSFLLEDLVKKKADLTVLYSKCMPEIIECIYNLHDLERCIKAVPNPSDTDTLLKALIATPEQLKKVFAGYDVDGDDDQRSAIKEETIQSMKTRYPTYATEIQRAYDTQYPAAEAEHPSEGPTFTM